jgi:hypothetical protein
MTIDPNSSTLVTDLCGTVPTDMETTARERRDEFERYLAEMNLPDKTKVKILKDAEEQFLENYRIVREAGSQVAR